MNKRQQLDLTTLDLMAYGLNMQSTALQSHEVFKIQLEDLSEKVESLNESMKKSLYEDYKK
jgi:hypothetical protein